MMDVYQTNESPGKQVIDACSIADDTCTEYAQHTGQFLVEIHLKKTVE